MKHMEKHGTRIEMRELPDGRTPVPPRESGGGLLGWVRGEARRRMWALEAWEHLRAFPSPFLPPAGPQAAAYPWRCLLSPVHTLLNGHAPPYTHRVSVSGLSEPRTSVSNTFSYKQQKNMMSSALNTRGLFFTCHKKARGGQLLHKKCRFPRTQFLRLGFS